MLGFRHSISLNGITRFVFGLIAMMMPAVVIRLRFFLFMFLFSVEKNENFSKFHTEIITRSTSSIQLACSVPNLSVDNDEVNQHTFTREKLSCTSKRENVQCWVPLVCLCRSYIIRTKITILLAVMISARSHVSRLLRVFILLRTIAPFRTDNAFPHAGIQQKSSKKYASFIANFYFFYGLWIDTLFCCYVHFCWVPLFYSFSNIFLFTRFFLRTIDVCVQNEK